MEQLWIYAKNARACLKNKNGLTWHIDTSNRSKCPEVSALMSCSMSLPNSDL